MIRTFKNYIVNESIGSKNENELFSLMAKMVKDSYNPRVDYNWMDEEVYIGSIEAFEIFDRKYIERNQKSIINAGRKIIPNYKIDGTIYFTFGATEAQIKNELGI